MNTKIVGMFVCMLIIIPAFLVTVSAHQPPEAPEKPTDITLWHNHILDKNKGICGRNIYYTYTTSSNNTGEIYYKFFWGDGTDSGWLGPYASGELCSASHTWTNSSLGYNEIATVSKVGNQESTPSPELIVRMYKLGDTRGNDWIGFDDIGPFVLMIGGGQNAYYNYLPNGYWFTGDINKDKVINFGDINPFIQLLCS